MTALLIAYKLYPLYKMPVFIAYVGKQNYHLNASALLDHVVGKYLHIF